MRDRWVAVLGCGHHAPTPPRGMPPRVGQWVSCPAAGCRRQAEVTAVDGPAYIQDRLL